jgi:hypothetical protein
LHVHLFLNHIPVIGGVGALLLLGWGLLRRSIDVTMAALVALIIVGLITVPVFLTGDGAVSRLRSERGFSEALLEEHKDAALAALVGLEAAAAVAAAALFAWWTTRRYPFFATGCTLVMGIAAVVLLARATALGGRIAHGELNAPAISAPATSQKR